tara:strand:+ start:7255 stop:8406 length:1152 start_codon:yes stop_codon:yes gene_type:complete
LLKIKDNIYDVARAWYVAQNRGSIRNAIELSAILNDQLKKVNNDQCYWPTCFLPSNISDDLIDRYAQARQKSLRNISPCVETNQKRQMNRERNKQVFLSACMSSHINSYPIKRLVREQSGKEFSYHKIPRFLFDLDTLPNNSDAMRKRIINYTENIVNIIENEFSGLYGNYSIIDCTYGLPESIEGIASHIETYTTYRQSYGYFKGSKMYIDPNSELSEQNWGISSAAKESILTKLEYLKKNTGPVAIAFICAPYKYSPDLWNFLRENIIDGSIYKIGLCSLNDSTKNFYREIDLFGIPRESIDIVNGISREDVATTIINNYNFAVDMYQLGGSSFTPILLRRGFPVIHQINKQSYFSRRQCINYTANKLELLIRKQIIPIYR